MPDDELVYDDDSVVETSCEPEDAPRSGVWVDSESVLVDPTPDEVAMGDVLGEQIDVDDDDDNGSRVIEAIEELNR